MSLLEVDVEKAHTSPAIVILPNTPPAAGQVQAHDYVGTDQPQPLAVQGDHSYDALHVPSTRDHERYIAKESDPPDPSNTQSQILTALAIGVSEVLLLRYAQLRLALRLGPTHCIGRIILHRSYLRRLHLCVRP